MKRVKPFLLLGILVYSFLAYTFLGSSTRNVVVLSNSVDRHLAEKELEGKLGEFNILFQFIQP
jgi:hypothetical protein